MMKRILQIVLAVFISYSLYCQPYLDRHSAVKSDAWISNTKTTSPNTARGAIHWIRYDLGETYSLQKSKFWNLNVPDTTNAGAKRIIIDYSLDGSTWKEWGKYDLLQAPGSSYYEGMQGPDFSGLAARYILINIISNHGHPTLAGLGEMKIDVVPTTVSVVDIEKFALISLNAAPNPFTHKTRIKIENLAEKENVVYQITDSQGRLILKNKLNTDEVDIDAENWSIGMYYFSVIHKNGIKSIPLELIK